MGKINPSRVFLGGMAAGGFSVALEYIAFLLGAYDKLGKAAGLPLGQAPLSAQLSVFALEVFVGGPLAIWLYAAIRPRFGAGPRTAIRAAVYIWLVMCVYGQTVLAISHLMVMLPVIVIVIMEVMSLPLVIFGVLIGAKIYQEDGSAASAVLP